MQNKWRGCPVCRDPAGSSLQLALARGLLGQTAEELPKATCPLTPHFVQVGKNTKHHQKTKRSGDDNSLKRKPSHLLGWKNYTSPESTPNPLASGSLCCRATWQFPTSSWMASSSPQSLGQAGPPNRYPARPAGPQIPQHPNSGGEGQGHPMDRSLHPSFKWFGVIY